MFATQTRRVMSGVATHGFLRVALVAVLAVAALPELASAQKYKSIEPQIDAKASRALRAKASRALGGGQFAADAKKSLDDYYKQFFFPSMTKYDSQSMMILGKLRADLIKKLRSARQPQAQQHLTELTRTIASKIARDNYHPAVRYNASLILGLLDQKYPGSGGDASPPVVLSAGTNELLELLEAEEFNGVTVHPSVKVGALQGLERHVQAGMDAQYAQRVTQAALGVLNQDAKALEIDTEVNNWMKCQAARVLARQFKDGPTKEVQDALTALIASDELSLDDRCLVSGLLEKIAYAAGTEASDAVVPLGNLTKAVVDEGAEVAREYQELILGNTSMARRPTSFPTGRNADTGPKLERRQLLSRLIQIEQGAKSLSGGLAEPDKQKLASLTGLLGPVIKESKDSKASDIDLSRNVLALEDSIDNLVASWQPAAAVPAADDIEFSDE